jgi:D-glycero-D-manno-heptose 1,7-bisphosphate phosphatase
MSTFLRAKHAILRALAFFRSKPVAKSVPAIFLDRDGTINVDHGYVHEIDNFEFIDGVIDAMRQLKRWATRWWW